MMAIVGSRATMLYYNDLRIAGAQVRKVLLAERRREVGRRCRHAAAPSRASWSIRRTASG